MKSTTRPQPRLNPLHCLIQNATHAPASDLAQIENIMRDEIFHSTLDWQTRVQLGAAARQAFAFLNENRELYDFSHGSALAMFQKMRDESATK